MAIDGLPSGCSRVRLRINGQCDTATLPTEVTGGGVGVTDQLVDKSVLVRSLSVLPVVGEASVAQRPELRAPPSGDRCAIHS